MSPRLVAALIAGLAALAGVTVAAADGSQTISATIRAEGDVTVRLQVPSSQIRVGEEVMVSAEVANGSGEALRSARLILHVDEVGLHVQGGSVRVVGRIASGSSASVTWSVCAKRPGNYLLLSTVDSAGPGGRATVAESQTVMLSVNQEAAKCHRQ